MRVIGVVSGKGGVGKTTTVANLGAALASVFGRKVLVIDANFTTPDVGLHLGMYRFPNTLEDVLDKRVPSSQAIYDHPSGMGLISASLAAEEMDARGLKRVLKELKGYETVLIDSAPGAGEDATTIIDACDEILIVTNPEFPAITDSLKIIELAKSLDIPIRGIVLNRVMREGYELSVYEVESTCDAPVIAIIPEDAEVRKSISDMNPVVLNSPDSPAAVEFTRLAAHLIGREYIAPVGALDRVMESTAGMAAKTTGVLSETEKRAVGVFSIIIGLFVGLANRMTECTKFLIECSIRLIEYLANGIAGLVNGTARLFAALISGIINRLRRIDELLAWVLGGIKEDIKLLGSYLAQLIRRLIECILWLLSGIGGLIVISASKTANSLRISSALFAGLLSGIAGSFIISANKVKEDIKSFGERLILSLQKISDLPTKAVELFVDLVKKIAELLGGAEERTVEVSKSFLKNVSDSLRETASSFMGVMSNAKENVKLLADYIIRLIEYLIECVTQFVKRIIGLLIKPKEVEEVELPREVAVEVPKPVEPGLFPELEERPSIFDTIARSFTGLSYKIEEGTKSFVEYVIQLIKYLIEYTGRLATRIAELSAELTSKSREGIDRFLSKVRESIPIIATKVAEFSNSAAEALARLTGKLEVNAKLLAEYLSRLITYLIDCIVRLWNKTKTGIRGLSGDIKEGSVQLASGVKESTVELTSKTTELLGGAEERTVEASRSFLKKVSDSLSDAANSLIGVMGKTKENIKLLANYIIRSIEYLIEYIVEFARRIASLLIKPREVELPEIKEREMVTEIPVPVERPPKVEEYPAGVFDVVKRSLTDLLGKVEENVKSFVEHLIQLIKYLIELLIKSASEIKVALIGLAVKTSGFLSVAKERTAGLLNNIAELSTKSLAMAEEHLELFVKRLIRFIRPEEVELPREVAVEVPKPVEPGLFPELEERLGIFDTIARSFTGLSYKIEEGTKSFVEYLIQLIKYLIECTGRLAERIAELSAELTSKARERIGRSLCKIRESTAYLTTKIVEFLNNTAEALARLTGKLKENVKLLAGYLGRLIMYLIECIVRLWNKAKTDITGLSGNIKESSVQLATGVKESTVGLRSKTAELVGEAEERTIEVSRSFLKKVSESLRETASSFMGVMSNAKENVKLLANYIIRLIEYLIEYIVEFARRIASLLIKPREVELPEIKEREMATEIPVPVEWVPTVKEYPAGVFDAVKISLIGLANKIEENIKLFVEYVIQLIKRLIELLVRSTSEIKVALIGLMIKTSGFLGGAKERTTVLLNSMAGLLTRSLVMTKEYLKLFAKRLMRLIKPEEVELPREVAVEIPRYVEPELFPELEERPGIFYTIARSFTRLSYNVEEGTKSFVEYVIQLIRRLIELLVGLTSDMKVAFIGLMIKTSGFLSVAQEWIVEQLDNIADLSTRSLAMAKEYLDQLMRHLREYTGRLAERIGKLSVELTSKVRECIDQFLNKVREYTPIISAKVLEFSDKTVEALARLLGKLEESTKLLAGYLSMQITQLIEYIIRLVKRIVSLLKREGRVEYVKPPEVEVTEIGEGVVELAIKPPEPLTMGGRVSSSVKEAVESLIGSMNVGREYIRRVLRRGRE